MNHVSDQQKNILIIDANQKNCQFCRNALSDLPVNIFCAEPDKDSIAPYEELRFSIVIVASDIKNEFQQKILTNCREKNHNLESVLLHTGDVSVPSIELIKNGYVDIIEQPTDKKYIRKLVENLIERKKLRSEAIRVQTLLPIYLLGEKFLSVRNENEVFEELITIIDTVIDGVTISIMIADSNDSELRMVASKGVDPKVRAIARVKPGERVAGWVFVNGKPMVLNRETQHTTPVAHVLERSDIHAAISFPLIGNSKTIGVVNISHNRAGMSYSQSEIDLLTIICRQAAASYENIKILKEREQSVRLKTLFQQYVSPEVADILLSRDENPMQIGEIEQLTVLFADIRNFTLLVQKIEPKRLRKFLNSFFDLFADIVYSSHGTLDKFMGDAALVYFGSPIAVESPNTVAVSAAVEIAKRFEKLRAEWEEQYDCFKEIGLGIGISRGEMFLGNVGSSRRFDYTVIGTDVNIAQRMASDAKSGQILITSNVFDDVALQFSCKEVEKRKLRSVEKEFTLYSVKF